MHHFWSVILLVVDQGYRYGLRAGVVVPEFRQRHFHQPPFLLFHLDSRIVDDGEPLLVGVINERSGWWDDT